MGAHVKNTERRRKDLRPQASERAPMRGAERKERIPWGGGNKNHCYRMARVTRQSHLTN